MRTIVFLTALACAGNAAAQSGTARLFGRVLEHGNGDAIAQATVKLGTGATALTDKRGWFTFAELPQGRITITVEMLGYQTRSDSIVIGAAPSQDLEIRLSKKPIELPPLTVVARSRWLEENGFYERRMSGLTPRIVTAADIERRNRSQLTDVFSEMPSMRVVTLGGQKRIVRFMSSAGDPQGPAFSQRNQIPGCEPALFIDGNRYRDRLMPQPPYNVVVDAWDMLSPLTIEAIEVYRGGGAPPQYNDNCGTILIWTKRGG